MPQYPHRIRLRGPWDVVPPNGLPPRHITMPGRLIDARLAGFAGQVRLIRRFGFPGRLDDFERVWLRCDGFDGTATITVNDVSLGTNVRDRFAYDITSLLHPRNQLEVLLDAADDQAGLWGEVAMEVRCTAWLEDANIREENDTRWITGRVVGESPSPLDLYGIVDGQQAFYRSIQPTAKGAEFREALPLSGNVAKVELVHVSTPWWTQELAMSSV